MKRNYYLFPEKPVLLYEVYLPKKIEYSAKLSEVLGSFLHTESLKANPDIQKIITAGTAIDGFNEESFLNQLVDIISGYSIYEVDGRFRGTSGPIDERVMVIRFIIQDTLFENSMRENIKETAKEVIRYLITKRFAEEIGVEDEIWFIEYRNCWLQRWVGKE